MKANRLTITIKCKYGMLTIAKPAVMVRLVVDYDFDCIDGSDFGHVIY